MSNNVYQMIARAQAEYARCIDDDRLEEWPNHFHGTCVYKITTAANYRDGWSRQRTRSPGCQSRLIKGCKGAAGRECR
jgi:3-phenylpropionate/cinnamic acid dioxygenase small subunit